MNWSIANKPIAAVFAPLKTDNTLNLELIPIYIDHLIKIGIDEVSHATTLNIDAIAVLPPTYFKPISLDDLLDYCHELCKLAPKVPFLYYHIPEVTGITGKSLQLKCLHFYPKIFNFRAVKMYDFFRKVSQNIAQCPNLIGCKYTSIDLADANRTSLIENGKFEVILGAESVLLGALAMGIKASIGISYSVCGSKINQMIKDFQNGDFESARHEQNKIQEIFFACGQISDDAASSFNVNELIASFKFALKIIEPRLDCGPVRLPLKNPSVKKIDHLKLVLNS
uniref:N-acetylneuraminate lyase n=1 Tax=Romanomermis culicivorax TaxID=13658 RepID=A0A915IPE8_ROMCU